MKIGFFKQVANGNGNETVIAGKITTRNIRLPYLVLRRVENRMTDKAPVFEIFEPVGENEEIQIGTLWDRTMKETGESFLSGMIDDPSFRESLPIALFGNELDGFDVQWRREREPQTFGAGGNGFGQRRGGGGQRQSGGFAGGSTAGANGQYVGAGDGLDSDIPF